MEASCVQALCLDSNMVTEWEMHSKWIKRKIEFLHPRFLIAAHNYRLRQRDGLHTSLHKQRLYRQIQTMPVIIEHPSRCGRCGYLPLT